MANATTALLVTVGAVGGGVRVVHAAEETDMPSMPRGAGLRRLVQALLVVVLVGALAYAATRLPLDRRALDLVAWIDEQGALGIAAFALVYVAATVLMLPGSLLTLGAGFVWGPLAGTAIVSPVSVAAACAAFVLGRTVARPWVARRVAGSPRFRAVDDAVSDSGFRVVFLLRLSPVFPFNLLNYALGLTRVRLRDFALASFVGMLPGTFLYVYLGSAVTNVAELVGDETREGAPGQTILFYGGLVATVIVTVSITRLARRALVRSLPEGGNSSP